MRRHNRRLFRVARSVLRDGDAAEDAVQEAYLRAFTKLDSYKPTGKFGAWLTRVAFNEALMIRRRDRDDTVSLDEVGDEVVGTDGSRRLRGADRRSIRRGRACARAAGTRRSTRCRRISAWCSCCGSSRDSTSAKPPNASSINATTVRTRLFRAQRQLRRDLSHRPARREHGDLRLRRRALRSGGGARARATVHLGGNAQPQRPRFAAGPRGGLHPGQMTDIVYSGARSSSGITGERFTVSSTIEEVTSRTPATRSRRRIVKSDSASMSRTITCSRKSISPVMV